jgi:hypothetical protein
MLTVLLHLSLLAGHTKVDTARLHFVKQEARHTVRLHLCILRLHPPLLLVHSLHHKNDDRPSDGFSIIKISQADSEVGQKSRQTHVIASGVALPSRHVTYLACLLSLLVYSNLDDQLLGVSELLDTASLVSFLAQCQFKFGGIAKAPDENPGT